MKTLIFWLVLASPAAAEITVRPWRQVAPAQPARAPYCPPRFVVLNNARIYGVAPQSPVQAPAERPAWTAYNGPVFGGTVSYGSDTADLDAPIREIKPQTILNPFCF
jgi:hypothetical protein